MNQTRCGASAGAAQRGSVGGNKSGQGSRVPQHTSERKLHEIYQNRHRKTNCTNRNHRHDRNDNLPTRLETIRMSNARTYATIKKRSRQKQTDRTQPRRAALRAYRKSNRAQKITPHADHKAASTAKPPPRLFRGKAEVVKRGAHRPPTIEPTKHRRRGAPRPPTRGAPKAAPVRLRRPSRPETYGDKGAPGIYRGCGCAPRATIPEGPTAGIDGEVGV